MINFIAGAEKDGNVYFSAWEHNAFCKADIETGEVEFLCFFDQEEMIPRLHNAAFLHEGRIWFTPCTARNIVCVNIDTLEMEYYPISSTVSKEYRTDGRFQFYSQTLRMADTLYLIPYSIDTMATVDLNTNEIDFTYVKEIDPNNEAVNNMKGVIYDDKLVLLTYESDAVKIIDIGSGEIKEARWRLMTKRRGIPFVKDEKIYIIPMGTDSMSSYNPRTKEIESYKLPESDAFFANVMMVGDDWVIAPFTSKYFLVMDSDNNIKKYLPEDVSIFSLGLASFFRIDSSEMKMMVSSDRSAIIIFGDRYDDNRIVKLDDEKFLNGFYGHLRSKYPDYGPSILRQRDMYREGELSLRNYLALV